MTVGVMVLPIKLAGERVEHQSRVGMRREFGAPHPLVTLGAPSLRRQQIIVERAVLVRVDEVQCAGLERVRRPDEEQCFVERDAELTRLIEDHLLFTRGKKSERGGVLDLTLSY
jgi:hypothetical protein